MAIASAMRTEKTTLGCRLLHASHQCGRCGGLLVREICMDVSNSGEWEVESRRCVQCGDIMDPVIAANRTRRCLITN